MNRVCEMLKFKYPVIQGPMAWITSPELAAQVVDTRFILSQECRAADVVKEDILNTHPDDYIVFTQANGYAKWRTTPHKIGKEGLVANKNGDLNPPSGSFYYEMFKGDLDASVNTVSNVSSLIKTIDPCENIVLELAAPFTE